MTVTKLKRFSSLKLFSFDFKLNKLLVTIEKIWGLFNFAIAIRKKQNNTEAEIRFMEWEALSVNLKLNSKIFVTKIIKYKIN